MPLRRNQIAMTDAEIRAYLKSQMRLIIVSNGPDGYPHPMPMNFILDDEDRVVVTTFRKSRKVRNFRRDPRASLLVESGFAYTEVKSVLAYAMAEIVDDRDIILQTMEALASKDRVNALAAPAIITAQAWTTVPKRVVIRFRPHTYVSWDHAKLGQCY